MHKLIISIFLLKFAVGINSPTNLSSYLWRYPTVPQNNTCLSNPSQQCSIPTGRVLGGGSTVNGMVYMRGNRIDFDNWENIYGAKGWSYKKVLPYFLKSENNTDTQLVANSSEYHSTGGPLGVSSHKNPDPIYKTYLEAANKLGYPTVDINGQNQSGIAIMQSTIGWDGIRSSTANAFLVPNRKRQNLHIITSAFVTKILFDKQIDGNVTASGVIFLYKWTEFYC